MAKPIIKSVLDLDRYKLTMGQFVFLFYKNTEVEYSFINRSKDEEVREILVSIIPYVNQQFDLLSKLRITYSELAYMKETGIYFENYLNFLSQINLKKIFAHEIIVDEKPQFQLTYSGLWSETIIFETYCLSIIAELYSRVVACKKYSINNKLSKEEFSNLFLLAMSGDEDILQKINTPYYQEAMKRLDDKILILKNHPEIKFFDFSTRRRFSQELQENILLKLSSEFHRPQFIGISQFLGTSNEYIGFKHSMKVGGTYAHEMLQVITALSEPDETNMLNAQYEFMRKWNKFYGYDLSVGLTDTFGSDSFFKNCPEDIANMYSFREDSSTNIYKYTNDVLDLYKKFNINHNEKVIVHSNGLDIGKVLDINSFSQNKISKVYGIGTNIGADVGNNYKNISIVIKATKVNGIDTVKLSDNIAKAIGKKEKIELYKKVFGYQISTFVEQIY